MRKAVAGSLTCGVTLQVARLEHQSELLDFRLRAAKQDTEALAQMTAATAQQQSKKLDDKQVPYAYLDITAQSRSNLHSF